MNAHYFSEKQYSPLDLTEFSAVISGKSYTFFTGSGVFSKKKIDYGTKVLVENMLVTKKDVVLDLGCGIGIVGKVASFVAKKVVMVDVNKRAVKLARMNTKNRKNVDVLHSDMFSKIDDKMFTVVLLNPPQTAGKDVCHKMIQRAKDHLEKRGSLQIVARHNKGGGMLSKYMEEVFGNVDTIVKQGGYRVYVSYA